MKLTCPSFGEAGETGNKVAVYPSPPAFQQLLRCLSNAPHAYALGLAPGPGQSPGTEARTGSPSPVLALGPCGRHVAEAAWLGQEPETEATGKVGLRRAGEKPSGPTHSLAAE